MIIEITELKTSTIMCMRCGRINCEILDCVFVNFKLSNFAP